MLKTNVITQIYRLTIRDNHKGTKAVIHIKAESLETAKLKIPEGWSFVEEEK